MAAEFGGRRYPKYMTDIMLLYKQRQDIRAYLEILLSLATVSMFIIFAIKPTLVTIADLLTKIKSEQDVSTQLDTKIKNLTLAQNLVNSNQSKINLVSQAIPDNPDIIAYTRQLEGLMKKDNVTATNIASTNIALLPVSSPGAQAKEAAIVVAVSGTYQDISNFIIDLENLRRPSIISKTSYDGKVISLTLTIPYN